MVDPCGKGYLQLGSNPINARYQDGLGPTPIVQLEQASKSANFGENSLSESPASQQANALLGLVGLINVYPGIAVTENRFGHHG